MHKPLIKICGVKQVGVAEQAVQLGAHFIGLIFHPKSRRYVTVQHAALIAAATKYSGGIPVAVFVNHSAKEMQEICDVTQISCVQLHGDMAKQQHHLLPAHFNRIYALAVETEKPLNFNYDKGFQHCQSDRDYLLFDSVNPGTGSLFDWNSIQYPENFRMGLAGGLNSENVAEAILQVSPWIVDVSSGVENASGEKDIQCIEKFIRSVGD